MMMVNVGNLRGQILALADAYEASGRTLWRPGHEVSGGGKFFARLRSGGRINTDKYECLIDWFHENWPDDAVWPAEAPRPQHVKWSR